MDKRNRTLDLVKGIAIILMVIGHCYHSENAVLRLIYAFHMPFFFIVSGILYADKWQNEIKYSLYRTGLKLLIPYYVFDALFCLFVIILGRPEDLPSALWNALTLQVFPMIGATVTWFLPCQFMVLGIFSTGAKHLKKSIWIGICLFAYIIAITTPTYTLLPVLRSLVGVGFFAVGFYGKSLFDRRYCLPLLCCVGVVYVVLVKLNGMVSLVSLRFSNPWLYTVNSLLGSWLLYQVGLRIPRKRWLSWIEYLGKNSVIVLCTHMFFVEAIRLLDYKLFNSMLYKFGILEGFVFGAIVVGLMFPAIDISNRYLGKLFGK